MSETSKPNGLSSATKNGCFTALVICLVFVVIMASMTYCLKVTRESQARLCADYSYQCGEGKDYKNDD